MKLLLLFLFWSLWYINFSSRTIFSPLLPLIQDRLSIDNVLAGSLFTFISVGYAASLLVSGLLSPRIGYKRSIAIGLAILSLSFFGLHYAPGYISFAVIALFIGLGSGIYLPCAIPLLTAAFDRSHWGKVVALHDTAASLSILSIPLLATAALRFFQWRDLFLILGIVSSAAVIFFLIFCPDPPPPEKTPPGFRRILLRRDFWIISTLWVFAAANGLGLYNIIPLFLVKGNHMPLETANTVFGLSRIGGFLVSILAGFMADRVGVKKILFSLLLITGLSTTALALAPPVTPLIIVLIIEATISTGFFPVALVAISKLTQITERSAFMGATIAVGVVFGLGLTPVALGAVADKWNFDVGFLALGLLTVASSVLLKGI
jgi:NNP family nitrate/nitrite transporter-like MFS transporter